MDDVRLVGKLMPVRLLVLDVDGVLTDSGIYLGESEEMKRFTTQDGMGISLLQRAGIAVAIITARESRAVERRAGELKITHLYQGRHDKLDTIKELAVELGLEPAQIMYMGDDLVDLRPMRWVGVGAAPANACVDVRNQADIVTHAAGGYGAVREVAELILRSQNRWQEVLKPFLELD
ncbi:HAD hydrolase family protein [bacterium]|nr:HAD hydrolase family protein [bacterium]